MAAILTPEEEDDVRTKISSAGYTPVTIGRERLRTLMGYGENKSRRVLLFLRGGSSFPHESGSVGSGTRSHPTESHERRGDRWTVELQGTRIKTLEEMLAHCHVDLKEWEVERYIVNKWEVGRKDRQVELEVVDGKMTGTVHDSGKVFVEPLFQVKVWLKKKVVVISIQNEITDLKELAKTTIRRRPPKAVKEKINKKESPYLLELSIPDVHIGRLARGDETGWDNYDSEIAKSLFDNAIQSLVERTRSFVFRQIVFVVGNDMLNSDNLAGTTTYGTPQANDTRYHKVFGIARNSLIDAVEILRRISNVKIVVMPGNHDTLAAWHLGDSLEAYFHMYPDVVVDNSPAPRKYHRFGDVMLAWAHGSKSNVKDLPAIMAAEQPEMFGATRFREIHTADKHHVKLEEYHGVRVRILPSLAAPDNWSSDMGFVGAVRGAEAYVWHKNQGLVNMAFYSVLEQYAKNGAVVLK